MGGLRKLQEKAIDQKGVTIGHFLKKFFHNFLFAVRTFFLFNWLINMFITVVFTDVI